MQTRMPRTTVRPSGIDLHRIASWIGASVSAGQHSLRWASHRTGLPVVVVASLAVVASFRLLRRPATFAAELLFTVVVLVAATRFGWVRW